MDFLNDLLEMPFFLGILFLVLGVLLYYFPPKKINIIYGYKTQMSMKSQQSWNFAQKFSAIKMIQSGGFCIIIYFIELFLNLDNLTQTIIEFLVLFGSIVYIIFFTEKALKSKFPIK